MDGRRGRGGRRIGTVAAGLLAGLVAWLVLGSLPGSPLPAPEWEGGPLRPGRPVGEAAAPAHLLEVRELHTASRDRRAPWEREEADGAGEAASTARGWRFDPASGRLVGPPGAAKPSGEWLLLRHVEVVGFPPFSELRASRRLSLLLPGGDGGPGRPFPVVEGAIRVAEDEEGRPYVLHEGGILPLLEGEVRSWLWRGRPRAELLFSDARVEDPVLRAEVAEALVRGEPLTRVEVVYRGRVGQGGGVAAPRRIAPRSEEFAPRAQAGGFLRGARE